MIEHGTLLPRAVGDDEPAHDRLNRLEAQIMTMPRARIVIVHHFSPGVYAREMRAPKGSVITGRIHKTQHLNIVSAGCLRVYNALGDLREIRAPYSFISDPGTRRAAVVREDVVWITVHPNPTDEQDPEKLEQMLVMDANNPLIVGLKQPEALPA